MTTPRLFIAQDALETWISEGHAEIHAEELLDRDNDRRFVLRQGVRFLEEVSGAPDAAGLLGKVKDLEQLTALGGEHMEDSVILGDNAYRVQPGFVGTLKAAEASEAAAAEPKAPDDLDATLRTVPRLMDEREGEAAKAKQSQTIVALQKFFLNNVK